MLMVGFLPALIASLPFCKEVLISREPQMLYGRLQYGVANEAPARPITMSKPPYNKTLSGPQIFVWRMFLFVVLVGLIAGIFHEKIWELVNFSSSTPLKMLIIGVLIFGIMLTFQQVLRLYPEVRWVNNFRISDPAWPWITCR